MNIWGDLPKAQDDPTTIDEEIASLITDHNNDPDAHLEAGQSLQSHKASEIIDHLAYSIIEDKIATGEISSRCITTEQIIGKDFRTAEDVGSTVDGVKFNSSGIEMWQSAKKKVNIPISGNPTFDGKLTIQELAYTKYILQTIFETLDGWAKTAGVSSVFGQCILETTAVANNEQSLNAGYDEYLELFPNIEKNPVWEALIALSYNSNYKFLFGLGPFDTVGIGFELTDDNGLRAIWYDENGDYHYRSLTNVSEAEPHIFRVEVIYGESLNWYVDGELVKSVDWITADGLNALGSTGYFYVKTYENLSQILLAYRMLYYQDL